MKDLLISIIIPHKNIPQLLTRCLQSIPITADKEVLIVDDNSDPEVVDFTQFPGSERPDVQIIRTYTNGGAGYARNVGLERARGKWLMFIDADDFYTPNAFDIVREYVDSNYDLIYTHLKAFMSSDLCTPSRRADRYNTMLDSHTDDYRFFFDIICAKIIRRELVERTHARCEETYVSNDVHFSLTLGVGARNIAIDNRIMTIITERPNSLTTHHHTRQERATRFKAVLHRYTVLRTYRPTHYNLSYLLAPSANPTMWLPLSCWWKYLRFDKAMALFFITQRFAAMSIQLLRHQ